MSGSSPPSVSSPDTAVQAQIPKISIVYYKVCETQLGVGGVVCLYEIAGSLFDEIGSSGSGVCFGDCFAQFGG